MVVYGKLLVDMTVYFKSCGTGDISPSIYHLTISSRTTMQSEGSRRYERSLLNRATTAICIIEAKNLYNPKPISTIFFVLCNVQHI